MGVTGSSEAPGTTERKVHFILSDPANLEQAFSKVWKRIEAAAGSSLVEKSAVLEEIFDLIGNEGLAMLDEGTDDMDHAGRRTARQLKRAVEILPDPMTRKEALNLFRNILLTVQSALLIKNARVPVTLADSPSSLLPKREANAEKPEAVTITGVDGFPASERPSAVKVSHEEDLPGREPLAQRLHPLLGERQELFDTRGPLPTRTDLEAQMQSLRRLRADMAQSTRAELSVVRELQHETAKKASSRPRKDEIRIEQLRDTASEQRREIEALLSRRHEEELEVDEIHRAARELSSELRSSRRACGSLESEIASEEARAAALRDAFEGRRARYATAETAARNAEMSTMRATRRRIAAEITARREEEAVSEAQQMRSEQSARAAQQCEALAAEIGELRAQALGHSDEGPEQLLAYEEAEAQDAARELQELEASIDELENHTATRESEMFAMQRRRLRERSTGGSRTPRELPEDEERLALQAVEARVAAGRRNEQALRRRLQQLWKSRPATANQEELKRRSSEAWQRCRGLAQELGEASAALARRRAEERFSGKEVVDVLKEELKAALKQEEENEERLAQVTQVRSETAEHLSEPQATQAEKLEGEDASWLPSLLPTWLTGEAK